ncbi:Alp7A family actin-like protein [Lactococcus hircilactis]|uniref:Alp7A family actin-like protein n=1 Tax=Lactococcus hircilactis TaxID=1494462 RepID=UPI003FA32DCC
MNTFAIDLGNKRIKMKSERGEYSYPSSYLNAEQVAQGGLGSLEKEDNFYFSLPSDSENSFIWGPHLEVYNLPERLIDTYARTGRMKQKKAIRILEFALGRLAMDYEESYESPLVVHLTLGLSITDLHKESDTVNILKSLAVGQHQIKINHKLVTVLIPSEEFLSIIPQYMGTVLNLAFTQDYKRDVRYSDGRIGVMDIGGGTILVNRSVALNPSPLGDERFEGVQNLIKEIGRRINSTKTFLIEQMLRSSQDTGKYIYRPSANQADIRDITTIVKSEIERYTRFTIAPLITENFPDIEELDFIVLTGGGASLLSKEALLDEIGDEYFERLLFPKESEFANVRGFYKGGMLKWRSTTAQENISPQGETSVSPDVKDLTIEDERQHQIEEAKKSLELLKSQISRDFSE